MQKILPKVVMLATAATFSYAAQVTDQFDVFVTVSSACTVAANDLDFGTYTGAQLDGTSTINVRCTVLTPYSLFLSAGLGGEADFTPRSMDGDTNSSQILEYDLYSDALRTTIWGDGNNGSGTQIGVGLGTSIDVPHTVFGRIPGSQNVQPQVYRDTITATVDY
jgi:spore coat protein U-like protein